jgi:uncharacterized membrane protein YqhA
MPALARPRRTSRLARTVAAYALADLITGLTAFVVIVLAAVWYVCVSMIEVARSDSSLGLKVGTPQQIDLAWVGAVLCLPLIGVALYFAVRAYRLPRTVLTAGDFGR